MIHLRRVLIGIGILLVFFGALFFFWCVFSGHWQIMVPLFVLQLAYLLGASFETTAKLDKEWDRRMTNLKKVLGE